MTDTCTTPGCTFPAHDLSAHPCGRMHLPNDPCQFCGKPQPGLDPCPDCWTDLTTMPLADIKALFAATDDQLTIGGLHDDQ